MSGQAPREWYYYDGTTQVGPITEIELRQQIAVKAVLANHYIFKDGFSDWKLLAEFPDLLASTAAAEENSDKRGSSPRAPIFELVVAHNDRHIATGTIRNISISGVFFETKDSDFGVNEEIKITLKEGRGLGKPLHLKGVIVRKSHDVRYPQGYGLELVNLDAATRDRISDYIERHQGAV
jgi:hypothetical protein